jgi:catechol 2,3-dioxygenase-like lactoylglutathione lyase family enzyme
VILGEAAPRLPVADLPRTVDFYRVVLGFEVELLWPEHSPSFAILARDRARLGFFLLDEHRPGQIGYAEVFIEVDDARSLHAGLRERVRIEWGPEIYSYGRREFAVRDPDSYLLIFSEKTDDAPTTGEPQLA